MEQYNLNFKNETSFTQDNFLVSECNKSAFDNIAHEDLKLILENHQKIISIILPSLKR